MARKRNQFLVGHWVRLNQPMKSAQVIAKMRDTQIEKLKDPRVRAKYKAAQNRPDVKTKKSIAMKRKYQEGYQNPMLGVQRWKDHPTRGKHHSEETKRRISQSVSGKKHWNWRGGLSFEPYTPEFNNELKFRIRKRDNFICQKCRGLEGELDYVLSIHHIDYNKTNNKESNLITLCRSCNIKVNSDRIYWEIFFQEKQCQRETT